MTRTDKLRNYHILEVLVPDYNLSFRYNIFEGGSMFVEVSLEISSGNAHILTLKDETLDSLMEQLITWAIDYDFSLEDKLGYSTTLARTVLESVRV